jgi:hypothetical protein
VLTIPLSDYLAERTVRQLQRAYTTFITKQYGVDRPDLSSSSNFAFGISLLNGIRDRT